jgi:hypothetical protein
LEQFDVESTLSGEPSKAALLQFLEAPKTKQVAELAFQWLVSRSSLPLQEQFPAKRDGAMTIATNAPTTMTLWEMLSTLAKYGERVGLDINMTIENREAVFVIGNIPEGKSASILIEELLAITFARLAKAKSNINHTRSTTTVRVAMTTM